MTFSDLFEWIMSAEKESGNVETKSHILVDEKLTQNRHVGITITTILPNDSLTIEN